ncbi:zinc ribbon domain-containing protein, partial [Pseudofrankia sp. BMG5.37]|uniref:zinc ribbon domain-containing protein n=1 Tax=Pseudofrankia sp. BMG5.37 TaxID=3050035 RepID=UPI0028946B16
MHHTCCRQYLQVKQPLSCTNAEIRRPDQRPTPREPPPLRTRLQNPSRSPRRIRRPAGRGIENPIGSYPENAGPLTGLLRCGRCGHRMTVSYHTPASRFPSHNYHCGYLRATYGTGRLCQHLAGPALDRYVTGQLLDAVAPAALEVSLTAAAHAEADRAELDTLWRQRLERARYTADRARRQYQLAEPENRLVTRQLE